MKNLEEAKITIINLGTHTRRYFNAPIPQVKWRSICIFFFTSILELYRITPIFLLHVRLEVERDELPRLLRFERSLFNKASRFWKHLNGLTCRCYKERRGNWYQCYNSSTSFVISKICFIILMLHAWEKLKFTNANWYILTQPVSISAFNQVSHDFEQACVDM